MVFFESKTVMLLLPLKGKNSDNGYNYNDDEGVD